MPVEITGLRGALRRRRVRRGRRALARELVEQRKAEEKGQGQRPGTKVSLETCSARSRRAR